jgi:two-component system nitrate/nitrite sensor histidine kinase NarX
VTPALQQNAAPPAPPDAAPVDQSQQDLLHQRALTKIDQLESLAAAIRAPRPLNAVIELVIAQIFDIVPADAAAVWLHDADNDLWYIGGARGLTRRASEISFKSDQTLHAKVGDQGQTVQNLGSAGFRRLYPEHDLIRGALYAPMKIAGRRVGLIALYRNTDTPFTEDDLRFVRTVGAHVGMAVRFAALEARAERAAVLEERARLGADLHDGILQILSSVRLYARELRSSLDGALDAVPADQRASIEDVLAQLETCVDAGSAELVHAVDHLRQPQPHVDLAAHLEATKARLEERGIATTLVVELEDLSAEVADAFSWISREAASNIVQHSLAQSVNIEVRSVGSEVQMTIADDGVGASAPPRDRRRGSDQHLGRRIMRERAAHVGGRLRVLSDASGTVVFARAPAVSPPIGNGQPEETR